MLKGLGLSSTFFSSRAKTGTRGFTLVEVLVALGVFAIMSSGYLVAVQKASRQMASIEERTLALWLAQNRLAELYSLQEPIENQAGQENYEMSEREWLVTTSVEPTAQEEMVKAVVQVALEDDADFSITSLDGYFYKPRDGSQ